MDEFKKNIELTGKAYDIVAKKYHELFKDELSYKAFDKELLNNFARYFHSNSKIYDMGCGPSGHIGKHLFDKGYDVTGVDISKRCVTMASSNNPEMSFLQMDMSKLNIEDQSIDGIIAYYSIIHVPKCYVSRFFAEFSRTLKIGGKLLISVKAGDDEGYIHNILEHNASIYFSHFNKSEIRAYFLENGFELISLEERSPYAEELDVKRIFALGEKTRIKLPFPH